MSRCCFGPCPPPLPSRYLHCCWVLSLHSASAGCWTSVSCRPQQATGSVAISSAESMSISPRSLLWSLFDNRKTRGARADLSLRQWRGRGTRFVVWFSQLLSATHVHAFFDTLLVAFLGSGFLSHQRSRSADQTQSAVGLESLMSKIERIMDAE